MPFFSVIIPVYNVENYLDKCLGSVVSQTFSDIQVIVVDDGSTDGSGTICDQWRKKDSRIIVNHKKNGGLSSARNAGLQIAEGEYILFLDSDDYWISNDALQEISDRIKLTNPDVLVFNLQKVYEGKYAKPYFDATTEIVVRDVADIGKTFVLSNGLWTACAWNKAIKKSMFENHSLYFREGITSEDVDWCYRLAKKARVMDYLNQCIVAYRQRCSSITGTITHQKCRDLLNNIMECIGLSEGEKNSGENLDRYLAYLYGTLLFDYAILSKSEEKRIMFDEINSLSYLLQDSDDPKIKIIRRAKQFLGMRATLFLLKQRNNLQKMKERRRD